MRVDGPPHFELTDPAGRRAGIDTVTLVHLQEIPGSDDARNRQYRAILSFDTSALPDNAVILSAQLGCAVNVTGPTQLRLRFAKDDDNDRRADYLSLSSGNAPSGSRPVLEVLYLLPQAAGPRVGISRESGLHSRGPGDI